MATSKQHALIRDRLLQLLAPAMPGIQVQVGTSRKWRRTRLTFRHASFADLLPEQRFRRILQRIPNDFYEQYLRGAVWFELAPGETEEDALRAPRSEDVADQEPRIARALLKAGFFDALEEAMGPDPLDSGSADFQVSRKLLEERGVTGDDQRDACLVFIRQGAYCDYEVLQVAGPALIEQYGRK